ncbi:acetylserotonin O-methyltransferase-like [Rhinophrynus dorsalis]
MQVLFSSCELGIFDLLSQSEEPLSAASVAERLGTNTSGTERLLSACVGLKLLDVDMQNGEVAYKNTELSKMYLTKSSSKSLYHAFIFLSNYPYLLANNLTHAVREGHSQNEKTSGVSSENPYEVVYRSEEKVIEVIQYIDSFWIMKRKEDVISAFDLSPFRSICDLGGCSGSLAKDLSSLYPETHFIVFDLPKVVQTVEKYFSPQNQHICFQQGDFFKDPLPEADLYLLTRVIYNWSDDKCLKLLKKVYNICKPGGGVFIAEDILNEDGHGPVVSQLLDLMLLTGSEGKVLFSSCELGIFDLLSQSEMPLSAASVAERLGTNTSGTERLLSACVGLKLLEVDMQNGEVAYKNTELSKMYLTKNSSKSLYRTFMFLSKNTYLLVNNLTHAVSLNDLLCPVKFSSNSSPVQVNVLQLMLFKSQFHLATTNVRKATDRKTL